MIRPAPMVFINYRSTDEPWAAIAVNNELSRRFGDRAVFLDAKSAIPGRAFDQTLRSAVRRSTVLLALMGSGWFTASDGHGRRLIDRPKDWVRQEIVEAFRSAVPVVPVLVGDVPVPAAEALPPVLRQIAKCPYVRLRHRDFQLDLRRLTMYVAGVDPCLAIATDSAIA
jgi:hypothetical protein